ncbi:MAG: hypothetical protein IJ693_02155 [Bacteroidaceae bacterium]|nr:hypothetical protein [Bacteroidaceae bacterium]
MKKLVFAAVAAIALTASVSFVSCDQKAAPAVDSIVEEVVDSAVEEVVDSVDSLAQVVDSVVAE